MHVHVCMCSCVMSACVRLCMCECAYVCMLRASVHVCVCACVWAFALWAACVHVCVCLCVHMGIIIPVIPTAVKPVFQRYTNDADSLLYTCFITYNNN